MAYACDEDPNRVGTQPAPVPVETDERDLCATDGSAGRGWDELWLP